MLRGRLIHPLLFTALLPLLLLRPSEAAAAAEPWDEPFAALPAALLRAAETVPAEEGAAVTLLLEEGRFTFEADGRHTSRYRIVYRVLTPEGVKEWANIEAHWRPWHQERPVLRARVCMRDGRQHQLDPTTVAEGPAQEESPDHYGDSRILRAPLPGVAVGTIVEQEIVTRERAPFFSGGVVRSFYFGKNVPVWRTRLVVEAPPTLPLRHVTRLLPSVHPRREEANGLVRTSFESGPLPVLAPVADGLPPELPRWPRVTFSTGASWAAVAARYGALVEAQLRLADVTARARQVVGGVRDRKAVISRLLEHLQAEVRYTALELGEGSIVPRIPGETLQRKYGDCKDQAALLVALLRAVGIEAQVALLRPGLDEDVEAELPGLGGFSHAIVHVPATPSIWIDPTVRFARAGELPALDQGRLALLISGASQSLVRTPEGPSQVNRVVETREFFLSESGPARVVETTEAWGSFEQSYRENYLTAGSKTLREHLDKYARAEYSANALTAFEHSTPQDLSRPFRLRLEVGGAERGFTEPDGAQVLVLPAELTRTLPAALASSETNGQAGGSDDRREDYILPEAFVSEHVYRIVPPPGFAPAALPASAVATLGPARLSQQWAKGAEGVVTGTLRFEIGKRRLTGSEFQELRREVRKLHEAEGFVVRFEPIGEARIAAASARDARAQSAPSPREASPPPVRSASPAPRFSSPSFAPEALLLPAESDVVMGMDVRGLFASDLWTQLMSGTLPGLNDEAVTAVKQLRSGFDDAMKEAEASVGLRPDRDVDRLLMAVRKTEAPEPDVVAIVLGRFDPARLGAALDAAEGQAVTRKTLGSITVRVVRKGKNPFALAFLSNRAIAVGDPRLVDAVVSAHTGGRRPLEGSPEIAGRLRTLKPGVGIFVLAGERLFSRIANEVKSGPAVPLPRSLALVSEFDGPTEITAEMAGETEARNLADVVRGALAVARMQAAQNPDFKNVPGVEEVLAGITVEAEATSVRLSVGTPGAGLGVVAAIAIPSLLRDKAAANKAAETAPQTGAPGGVVGVAAGAPSGAPSPAPVLRVGGEIKEPRKVKHVNPKYPGAARKARVEGIVVVECRLNPQGRVEDVKVLRSIPQLDKAAIEAVRQWVYTPTLVDGVAVPVIMTVTVNFRLS